MSVGDRLKQVRLARGFSLEDLVIEMGGIVTKQALSKYETGKAQPTLRVLNSLAETLKVKTAYFYEIPSFVVSFHGFRKKSRLRVRDQEKIQNRIKQLLEDRIKLQRLAKEESAINFPVQKYSYRNPQSVEKASLELREQWNLGLAPISSVVETLEEKRIHVLELDEENDFDGQSATVEDDACIIAVAVVSRRVDSGERQRLTLLHELGHVVLRQARDAKTNEKNAFRFAASFLVPEQELKELVGNRRRFLDIEELILLKKRFGISIQALLYRMKDLKIISQSVHKEWCILINRRGWKKEEPMKLPCEEPQWLRRTVFRGLAEGWLTRSDAEQMLGETVKQSDNLTLRERKAFMRLPIEQRRKVLEKQAQELAAHYDEDKDWKETESGDFIDY